MTLSLEDLRRIKKWLPPIPSMFGMLHDVDMSTTPPTNGQALIWNSTDSKWEPGSAGGGSSVLSLSTQTANYTLALTDAYTLIEINSASGVTVTIPPHSSVAFDVGAWIQLRQFGAGQVTTAAGTGVTLRSPSGMVKTCQQYATCMLHQRATNDWVLVGDLSA